MVLNFSENCHFKAKTVLIFEDMTLKNIAKVSIMTLEGPISCLVQVCHLFSYIPCLVQVYHLFSYIPCLMQVYHDIS